MEAETLQIKAWMQMCLNCPVPIWSYLYNGKLWSTIGTAIYSIEHLYTIL